MRIGRHHGRQPAILGLAVDLAHVDAEREVPADQVRRDRRRAGRQTIRQRSMPSMMPDIAQHQPVGDGKTDTFEQATARAGRAVPSATW